MPRDTTGTYAAPTGTTAIPGAVITADEFNNFVTDIGAEMTGSATVGQLEGLSGRYTTTGTGAAYLLTLPSVPSDLSKILGITFRAHATNTLSDVILTGTLTTGQTVIPDASTIGGLTVGQALTTALSPFNFTGSVVQGQYTITGVSSTVGLSIGMPVSSTTTGFATGTAIAAISGTTVTLSALWTGATATGLTFSATPGIQPGTTVTAITSTTTSAGVTTNTITLSLPITGNTVVGATITAPACTSRLTVNTAPIRSLVAPDGSALVAGEVLVGQFYTVFYNPTLLAFVLDGLPGRIRLSATDPKAGYLSGRIVDSKNNPLQTATLNGQQVLVLPDAGVAIGDFLNSGRNSPTGYLRRDGATYLQSAYPALYALIGQRFETFTKVDTALASTAGGAPIFAAGLYVFVVGSAIYTSNDLVTLTLRYGPTGGSFNAVTYGNSQFVASGSAGNYLTSPNGLTWTVRSGPTISLMRGIAYGATRYVAVGAGSASTAYSTDGITWSTGTAPFASRAIIFANGLFTIVGASGQVATSPDGLTWTVRTSIDSTSTWNSIIYVNGLYVVVGLLGGSVGGVMTSTDSITWTARPVVSATFANELYAVAYGFGVYYAVGPGRRIISSTDAINWRELNATPVAGTYSSCIAGQNAFVLTFNTTQSAPQFGGTGDDSFSKHTPTINSATQFLVPADDLYLGYIRAL